MPDDQLFLEKDKLRGLVPTSDNGKADLAYAAWFEGIDAENDPEFHGALARSQDPRYRKFLELMGHPNRRGLKIQTLAKQCGLDLAEFQQWYGKESVQMAIGVAQKNARNIVRDMSSDALTKDEFCDRCDGLGWVSAPPNLPVDTPGYHVLCMQTVKEKDEDGNITEREEPVFCRTCPKCKGIKTVKEIGDEHARDKILEIAGLTSKGKAVQVNVNNFGGASHASAVSGALGSLTIDVDVEPSDANGE